MRNQSGAAGSGRLAPSGSSVECRVSSVGAGSLAKAEGLMLAVLALSRPPGIFARKKRIENACFYVNFAQKRP